MLMGVRMPVELDMTRTGSEVLKTMGVSGKNEPR